jgi:hypothetical protein
MNTTKNEKPEVEQPEDDQPLKVGQLYTWDGQSLVPVAPSEQCKLPVTLEAMEAVRTVRARASRVAFRPCLMVTASQMLLAALKEIEDLPDQIFEYGESMYKKMRRKREPS